MALGSILIAVGCGCRPPAEQREVRPAPYSAQFFKPRGIGVGPSGRAFVVDMAGFITRFSPEGQVELRWELPQHETGTPSNLFVDRQERVLVPDTHNNRILIYDADGREVARFGHKGTGNGEFLLPNDLVIDSEGFIYVSEYGGNDRISKFDEDYQFVAGFGGVNDGSAALAAPYGMALDGEQCIWVADTGNHRVCRFDRAGRLLMTIGGLGEGRGEMKYPYDVAWVGSVAGIESGGADGAAALCDCILACEKVNQRIQVFDTQGRSRGVWGEPGRGVGQLDHPTGIAAGPHGTMLIADTGNNRIVALDLKALIEALSE